MASENNYEERFQQARTAYLEGDFDEAGNILDGMLDQNSDDPNVLLLRGHIHLSHEQYDVAKSNYQKVLNLTDREDLISIANEGLEKIENGVPVPLNDDDDLLSFDDEFLPLDMDEEDFENEIQEVDDEEPDDEWTESIQFENIEWDAEDFEEEIEDPTDPTLQQNANLQQDSEQNQNNSQDSGFDENPFFEISDDPDDQTAASIVPKIAINNTQSDLKMNSENQQEELIDDFDPSTFNYEQLDDIDMDDDDFNIDELEDKSAPTFVVASEEESQEPELRDLEKMLTEDNHLFSDINEEYADYSSELQSFQWSY